MCTRTGRTGVTNSVDYSWKGRVEKNNLNSVAALPVFHQVPSEREVGDSVAYDFIHNTFL